MPGMSIELEAAIEKARRNETLTSRDRKLLIERGLELAQLTDEPPEGAGLDEEEAPEVEDELLIRAAVSDAHPEDAIPWEVLFPREKLAG
jgi:hypothetical protein